MLTKDGRHPFKWLTFDGRKVRIDEDIAPLLSKMWKLGIRTTNSCQAQCNFVCKHKYKTIKYKNGTSFTSHNKTKTCYNSVWLAFETVSDIELFYNIVSEYHPDDDNSMYSKMSCDRFVPTGPSNKYRHGTEGWSFHFLMSNVGTKGHWGRPNWGGKRSTVQMWIEDGCDKCEFILQPQITFPRTHIEYVEGRLNQALKRKKK